MTLFTETEVTIGTTLVLAGAYTMYLLRGRKDWNVDYGKNRARIDLVQKVICQHLP